MYTCQICKKVASPGTKSFRIPVEFRNRKYPAQERPFHVRRNGKETLVYDPGGMGREIVREVTACPECVSAMNKAIP